jgi:hypothetical protein
MKGIRSPTDRRPGSLNSPVAEAEQIKIWGVLIFAYGSNMLERRLTARTPSAIPVGTAYVEEYRLTFDKVSTDGSGKCEI